MCFLFKVQQVLIVYKLEDQLNLILDLIWKDLQRLSWTLSRHLRYTQVTMQSRKVDQDRRKERTLLRQNQSYYRKISRLLINIFQENLNIQDCLEKTMIVDRNRSNLVVDFEVMDIVVLLLRMRIIFREIRNLWWYIVLK